MKKQLTKDDILIMILYLDIRNLSIYKIEKTICDINRQLNKSKDPFEKWYLIPINGESKIECLNPKLLSENEYQKVKEQFDKNQEKINKILRDMKERTMKLKKPILSPSRIIKKDQNLRHYKCKFCSNPGCYGECLMRKESEK